MQIIFETPRLIFRQFTIKDSRLILQLNSNPEVVKYVHEPVLENEEQAKNIITAIILPQYQNNLGRWAMHTKDGNEFIGWCGLKQLPKKREIDLGYRLKQNFWGKGFATEAASHTLDHGFKKLNLSMITGKAHTDNLASLTILKKIGMKYKGEEIEDGSIIKVFTANNPYLIS
ncbi:MAG: GNAT family N-acetyltransferase [Ferruginibacter sp.]